MNKRELKEFAQARAQADKIMREVGEKSEETIKDMEKCIEDMKEANRLIKENILHNFEDMWPFMLSNDPVLVEYFVEYMRDKLKPTFTIYKPEEVLPAVFTEDMRGPHQSVVIYKTGASKALFVAITQKHINTMFWPVDRRFAKERQWANRYFNFDIHSEESLDNAIKEVADHAKECLNRFL